MKTALTAVLIMTFSISAFAGLTYEGSSTIGEGVMPEAAKQFEQKTGVKFDSIGTMGSGKGYKAAVEGKVDVGGMSRALTAEEKKVKPYFKLIGYDAIAVFVNQNNPIKNLSKADLKGIFTGKITNWKQVGGKDASIMVITEVKSGDRATIKEFKELALDGENYGNSKEIDKPHDCVLAVAKDANAITHASLAFKETGAKALSISSVEPVPTTIQGGEYLLARPLVLLSKDLPSGDVKKFYDFISSSEGQVLVGKRFVPMR